MYIKPKEKLVVKWKKNKNHRGEAVVYSEAEAMKLADEKITLGFKVSVKKGG